MAQHEHNPHPGIGPREFVALIASLMAINALGIDSMLPALPEIGRALNVAHENDTQWIIGAYMFGTGAMLLFYGPLADRFGRKPVLLVTLVGSVLACLVAGQSATFALMIFARFIHGTLCGATRVLVVSVVRDCYVGRRMARVMSTAQMVFFAVPILAPSIGSVLLTIGPWRWIFGWLALVTAIIAVWSIVRLPETLHPGDRRPISVESITSAFGATLRNRFSLGYTLAATMTFASMVGYVNSSQQLYGEVFHRPDLFPYAFAGVAAAMGGASFANSRLVERFGTRRISHTALLVALGIAATHVLVSFSGMENLAAFMLLQALQLAALGLIGANFSSMAMEPVGHIAGTASSIQGFLMTLVGTAFGAAIGQAFDGTTRPVAAGFLICNFVALLIVLRVEKRLFKPHHADPAPAGH